MIFFIKVNIGFPWVRTDSLSWFAPILEKQSPLLNNFEEFISEFKACFGDTDSIRTAINKIRRLRQGDRPASAYAADFRLLPSDIPWDEQALMEQFRYGLRNDVKDLLLTFPEEPKSLTEAISRAVRCDNRLFERRSERQIQLPRPRPEPTYASVAARPFAHDVPQANTPTPMEIDVRAVAKDKFKMKKKEWGIENKREMREE